MNFMSRFIKKISKKTGLSPGTLVHIGKKKIGRPRIRIIDYTGETLQERELKRIEDSFPFKEKKSVTWLNIDGLHETDIIKKMGDHFGIHPLVLEDIVNTGQRPKLEDFDDYIFVVMKMLYSEGDDIEIKTEQISFIIGPHYLITFQERVGDVFEPVRERIRKSKGRLKKSGTDYLAYALIDAVVDNYFTVIEKFGDRIEELEDELLENPTSGTLTKIHSMKRELILLRKSVWPLRETISELSRSESKLIKNKTIVYLRDIYDHTIQVIDTIETLKETVSGMRDTYLSSISNKMNEVMKVLTIIATIFIPMTFIAGIYGMNFEFMPELRWMYGYFAIWGVMAVIAIVMLIYFRRKGWL
jgi:magnesium transporter